MNTTQPEQQGLGTPLTSTDADRRALIAQAAPSLEQAPVDGLAGTKEAPGFWASAKAGYLRHTTVSQALLAATASDASSDVADAYDPAFDYAEHWAANKADYPDMEAHYMAGHFDEVRSAAGWARRAFVLRENDALDRDIAEGGTLGSVAAFAGSLADPVNLLGIGIMMYGARAATRLGRAGQNALAMGADGVLGAAAMNALDPTYDWKDAVLDIGVSSMLGGTIGVMTRNVSPDSPLIPGHPDNPSLPANIKGDPVHIVKPGQATDEGSAMGQSIGAAAVSPEIGRLKERRFKWTEELLAEAQAEGFVENDLSYMMDRYTRDMGGRLALHEAFDGRGYASLAEETDRSLREWVSELPEGHPERAARESMHSKGLEDLKYMWDRNAGRMSVEPTDMAGFMVKTLMNGAYIRIAGGIWKAAVQDIGTAIFTNPRFVKQVLTNARAYSKLLKEIDARALDDADGRLEGLRQLKVLMASMENSAHTGVSPRAMGRGSALDQFGIGDGVTFQGRTQSIQAWVDELQSSLGMIYQALRGRICLGWSVERTLTTPVRRHLPRKPKPQPCQAAAFVGPRRPRGRPRKTA